MNSPQKSANSFHMIRTLGGVGILCSLLIVSVYQYTKPIIKRKKALALEQAIYNVVPGAASKVTFEWNDGSFTRVTGESSSSEHVFAALDDQGRIVGFAVEASGNGFQDVIHMIYGYDHGQQNIIGIQVLESKETPGLGDKIEKDEHFLANFESLDVSLDPSFAIKNPITLVKPGKKSNPWEIDSITGATISSKAVTSILKNSSAVWMPRIQRHFNDMKDQVQ